MAKIVIAGEANCPYFARAELLGDKLARNLPNFNLHKIIIRPEDWKSWLETTCKERGWDHSKSPLVWRELIDRGGKGVLIGGANEFHEYADGYYGIKSDMKSNKMTNVAQENLDFKVEIDIEEEEYKAQSKPLIVCITNASSAVCYAMIEAIGRGDVFGSNTEIKLKLFDSLDKGEYLHGVEMEVHDLALGLLRGIQFTSDITEAFKDCEAIVLLDSVVKDESMSKETWIKANADLFTNYAKVINEVANRNVRVLLCGDGPINFNAYMMIKNAPNISRQNFVALSGMVENHAKAVMAEKLRVNSAGVVDLIIWGNVTGEHYVDINTCRVHGYDGAIWGPPSFSLPAKEMVFDKKWLETEFPELVHSRQEKELTMTKHPSAMSQASTINTTLEYWWNGSPSGQMFSLAVCSEGWYGVPNGLVFSFPVTMHPKGYWNVVQDIDLSEEAKAKIFVTVKDLLSETYIIFPPPIPPKSPSSEKVADKEIAENVSSNNSKVTEEKTDEDTEGDEKRLATIAEDKLGETVLESEKESQPITEEQQPREEQDDKNEEPQGEATAADDQ
ncbi:hypothetical protein CHS0354_033362 [Potamilus streckersoni]|uniref:Malate dehydrogenase, cytoplasmic n=1 Tax=Potamilus streckersoni TaxID=2493646 RepID=A0AAE0VI92_9BIVA|nr:hypothetical protein CHS0354_033362 [Potamilus streckersoni]